MERRLAETFSETYRDDIGLPRYRQELERLHRPDIVYRNFSSHHAQVVNEMENARAALLRARREYVERFGPCSFRVEADDLSLIHILFENHSILQRIEGKFNQADCRFAILPTIQTAVSSERLNEVAAVLRKEETADEETEEDSAD